MTDVHQRSKVEFVLSLCFQNCLTFGLYFGQLPCKQLFELFSFFIHCFFRFLNFHFLKHRNKLMHQSVVTCQITSIFLHLFAIVGAALKAEILSAAERAEMADVEQIKKTVPFDHV